MYEVATQLPTPIEGLEAIHTLVEQTHWITGAYEMRCPWLDADGNPVVIEIDGVSVELFKVGFCLAGHINKMSCLRSTEHLTGQYLIGNVCPTTLEREISWEVQDFETTSFEVERRYSLAMGMGEMVWKAIMEDKTYISSQHEGIESWNDGVDSRDAVLRVLDRAIVTAKAA